MKKVLAHLVLAAMSLALLAVPQVHAAVILLANGALTGSSAGSYTDLSGLTSVLENGVSANLLGGMGSGLAYAGGDTFIAVPDRGPNAVSYDSLVDDTVSYIERFHTVSMSLTPNTSSGLPFLLTPTLESTILLYSPIRLAYGTGDGLGVGSGVPPQDSNTKQYFTGRSDNFDPTHNSGNPNDARLDAEGVRVSVDGRSVFISDEYGPYVYQFDRATGKRLKAFTLPQHLFVANLFPTGAAEISGNTSGRVANKAWKGLPSRRTAARWSA